MVLNPGVVSGRIGGQAAIVAAGLAPLGWLVWAALAQQLGANPAEALLRASGDWTLRLLCLSLAVTPLRQWLALPALARYRRTLGLLCFGWALLHLLAYLSFDQGWDLAVVVRDVAKRPFILVGMLCFALLATLAATSTQAAMRSLGRNWQRLHRLVYVAALLALLHFYWMRMGKNDWGEVAWYAGVVGVLLAARVVRRLRNAASPRVG